MKIYYAHCQSIYGTNRERKDIAMLEAMGFEVVNPNTQEILRGLEEFRLKNPQESSMTYFCRIAEGCGAIAFRGIPGGGITAGVFMEIECVGVLGKPVIELPNQMVTRQMTREQTMEYLLDVGQQ